MEYTESEVKELLRQQRKLCATALDERQPYFKSEEESILSAPEPKLKSDGNDKSA